eukprot:165623-Prorocentrum_minimum.AAC.1
MASDWSVVRIYPRVLRLIGPSLTQEEGGEEHVVVTGLVPGGNAERKLRLAKLTQRGMDAAPM